MTLPVGNSELLSASDEIRLAREIEVGLFARQALDQGRAPAGASRAELLTLAEFGRAAYDQFFRANLRLVAMLAARWAKRTKLDRDDLFQEGCIGLGGAIMRWDHARGVRFVTLANRMIEHCLANAALVRCGQLDTSVSRARAALEVRRSHEHLQNQLGRSVGVRELAEHLGRDQDLVNEYLNVGETVVLGRPDAVVGPVPTRSGDSRGRLAPVALALLPPLERDLLESRFGIGRPSCTQQEIAERLGVSATTVRRLENRALGMARRELGRRFAA